MANLRPDLLATAPTHWSSVLRGFLPQILWQHFDYETFRLRLVRHMKRWTVVYLTGVIATLWFNAHYTVALNITESLPIRFFLIHRGELPKRGDYLAFRWQGGGPYPPDVTFIKFVAGVPGDSVNKIGDDYYVNCYPTGLAKHTSRQGLPLEPGPTGILPHGRYYVHGTHPDSLDSRYALTGWVSQAQIIGRAHALF